MKKLLACILSLLWCLSAWATHNRAGEITYRHVSGYIYEITIITYTYTPSEANKSRGELPIGWGDGTSGTIPRLSEEFLPDNFTKNTYKTTHTFPGPGSFTIPMIDPNRNEGVVNIVESVNVPFAIS